MSQRAITEAVRATIAWALVSELLIIWIFIAIYSD